MPTHEYRLLKLPEASSSAQSTQQIAHLAQEGWEPVLMSGEGTLNIMLRRELPAETGTTAETGA